MRNQLNGTFEERTKGILSVLASTDDVDSHGEIVAQDFDLTRYLKNPVVLFEHGRFAKTDPVWGMAIGTAENVRIEKDGLRADIRLVDDVKVHPKIDLIREQIDAGVLRAISVRFKPKNEVNGKLSGNELTEISLCTLGSNKNTIIEKIKSLKEGSTMNYTEEDFKNFLDALAKILGGLSYSEPQELLDAVTAQLAEREQVAEALDAAPTDNLAEKASAKVIELDAMKALAKSTPASTVNDAIKAIVDTAEKEGKVTPASRAKTIKHGERFGLDSLKSLVASLPVRFVTTATPTARSKSAKTDSTFTAEQIEFARRNNIDLKKVAEKSKSISVDTDEESDEE